MPIPKSISIMNEVEARLRTELGSMSIVAMSLGAFATLIVRHARAGRPLDEEAVENLKSKALVALKNSEAIGVTIEGETAILKKAIDYFSKIADNAIAQSRQKN